MKRQRKILGASGLALSIFGVALAINGCTGDPPDTEAQLEAPATAAAQDGSTPISELPFVDAKDNTQVVAELLDKPTALGETTALHVKLPPPRNKELRDSLVRVVGPIDDPQVLVSANALKQLGVIKNSPGEGFFTAFATLPREQLEVLQRNQDEIKSGVFGRTSEESVVFADRSPIARTINPAIDPERFFPGGGFGPVRGCRLRPVSTAAAWGKSLFITDPRVVQDPARTWDPCTGAGTRGGVWTFSHFIREMAVGSGKLPQVFALDWLSLWLNTYVVNGDAVPARTQMFTQVIEPWARASGIPNATLTVDPSGQLVVDLHGRLLDLEIAPFRLLAIVNRIDLGETVDGVGGYSGTVTSRPKTAGELRFIFNVVQPNPWGQGSEATCGRKLFTTIFEYGVPIEGCTEVVKWAQRWTTLQSFASFSPAYLAQLEGMTERVVLHGMAPLKGNRNAINQIRTNEIALGRWWELREFTLTDEDPRAGTDTPSNGELRPHTVAQTPDDGAFPPIPGDPIIDSFVTTQLSGCNSTYTVPYMFGGGPFRGGNALIGPGHWNTSSVTLASSAGEICARHEFSLNTCGGCHQDDSGTNGFAGSTRFTHIDPLSPIPVTLSKFLTGGGPGLSFNVPDPQLGPPIVWRFADLERRFQRLFDISHCTSCLVVIRIPPRFIEEIARFGPIPGDPAPDQRIPFKVGPITDLKAVAQILDLRREFGGETVEHQADFLRSIQVNAE